MKENELNIDRKCHVLYSKPCKKEIQAKIALHYPPDQREAMWTRVQLQYVDFLRDWRTDLGGKKNFHNGVGGKPSPKAPCSASAFWKRPCGRATWPGRCRIT